MFIKKIVLKNFRNFSEVDYSFKNNLNFILGRNGSGKTSILEAVHYLAFTKSFRASNDREVICNDADFFQIFGEFEKNDRTDKVNLNFVKNEGKRVLINDKVLEKKRKIIGQYPVISLSPDDEKITKGSPNERRNFVDKILSQTNKEYFQSLLNYNRQLRQRNSLLKQYKEQNKFQYDTLLESVDELLIQDALVIVQNRKNFFNEFNIYFKKEIEKVGHFDYDCQLKLKLNTPEPNEKFSKNYTNKLKEKIVKDVILGRTSYGPHLDNIDVYFDNREVKKVASQGEHKIVLISLKMAEGKYIQNKLKATVIYLLDDLFAMLDSEHCMRTIGEISDKNQTLVTSTSLEHIEKEIRAVKNFDYSTIYLEKA